MDGYGGRRIRSEWIVAAGAAVIAAVALGVPLSALLVVGALLLCPLLMMGMHGSGHGHGRPGATEGGSPNGERPGAASGDRPPHGPVHGEGGVR